MKVNLPSPAEILSLDGEHAHLEDRISRIAGARIFAATDFTVTYCHGSAQN